MSDQLQTRAKKILFVFMFAKKQSQIANVSFSFILNSIHPVDFAAVAVPSHSYKLLLLDPTFQSCKISQAVGSA